MINWWNLSLADKAIDFQKECLENKNLSYGTIGKQLEAELSKILGVKYITLCTSGSVSLLIALKSLGLSSGDEVILPDVTFQATYNAIRMTGATPVLCPIDPDTGLMDLHKLNQLITPDTQVILPVHLNGRAADIVKIQSLIKNHDIRIIEDCAQGFYCKDSHGKYLGTTGDIGCFSMGVTKFLTTGQGGFLATNDEAIHNEIQKYIFHGEQKGNYYPTYHETGFNFRLSDILSLIALEQLKHIDEHKNAFISRYHRYYDAFCSHPHFNIVKYDNTTTSFPIWIEASFSKTIPKQELATRLKANSIGTYLIHTPIHKSISDGQFSSKSKKLSELFWNHRIVIPSGPDLTSLQIDKTIATINLLYKL